MGKNKTRSVDHDLKRPALVPVIVILLALGTLIALNLVWHHEKLIYGATGAELIGCGDGGAFDCDKVNTSDESELFGIPIAVFGIPTYLVMAALALHALKRRRVQSMAHVFSMGAATVLYSAFLLYVSKVELEALCLWCMSLYAVNLTVTALSLLAVGRAPAPLFKLSLGDLTAASPVVRASAVAFLAVLAVSVLAQKGYRRSLAGGERVELSAPKAAQTPGSSGVSRDPEGTLVARSFDVVQDDGSVAQLSVGPGDLWKGNPDAAVVVTEFADFQCGYCKRLGNELRRLAEAYEDRVLFVFKHFPMTPRCNPGVTNHKHAYACAAGAASECAGEQGLFWAFHDLAFKNQHALRANELRVYADEVGADLGAFDQCVADGAASASVLSKSTEGAQVGVKGTPTLFINGKRYGGARTAEAIAFAVEQALGSERGQARELANQLRRARETLTEVAADTPSVRRIKHGHLDFHIDTFEAALVDGKAVSAQGQVPATAASWFEARDACAAAGKRLCREEEWIAACQGAMPVDDDGDGQFADDMIEGTAYPHSDYHVPGVCWDARDRDKDRPVYTGSLPSCVSLDGVYDLTGNVAEWVGIDESSAALLGGGYDTSKDKARCYRRNQTFGPGNRAYRNGFRCCDD